MNSMRCLLLAGLTLLTSCRPSHSTFEEAKALFRSNQLDQAITQFRDLSERDTDNALALAYLADSYRRTGSPGRAVETARRALDIDPCLSFAHCVIAEATIPLAKNWEGTNADTAWAHLLAAAACDTTDGHPWMILWGESIRRGEIDRASLAARRLHATNFFSPAIMAYNRWVLTGLPERAILLTNGDMDTYPVAVLQEVERLRPDVVLVNRGTLNEPWYARYLRNVKGVAMPYNDEWLDRLSARRRTDGTVELPGEQIVQAWVQMWREGRLDRPITWASTIDEPTIARTTDPLQYCGAFTAVLREPSDRPDVQTIEGALSRFQPEDFFGPWVSDQDRSPIRRIGTKNIVRNVSNAALTLSEQAALSGDKAAFDRWLTYARILDNGSDLGPVFIDRIRQLEAKGVFEPRSLP